MDASIKWINLGGVNAYLLHTTAGFILFDCGFAANRAALQKELDAAGVTPQNFNLVVFTHGDIDHTGNGLALRQKYGVKLAMHPADAGMVKNAAFNPRRKVHSLLMRTMHLLFKSGFNKMMAAFETFSPDLLLEEGQSLQEFGLDARVLHTPGHTPGSICILLASGDLIGGDIIQNMGRPRPTVIVDNENDLAASLRRLSELKIQTVYAGHGSPFRMDRLR